MFIVPTPPLQLTPLRVIWSCAEGDIALECGA